MRLLNHILMGTLLLAVVGCVGTVTQAKKNRTESSEYKVNSNLKFEGITDLIPISHDKMEVYFYPASGGSKEYLYQIYVGNVPQPINVVEEVLQKNYQSKFRYTVTGLEIGTKYTVKVDVKDRKSNEVISTRNSLTKFTFSNYVADFLGIASVSNMSGVAGVDSIKVRWPHATIYPSSLLGSDRSPQAYEILIIDSTKQTPAALSNFDLTETQGRIVKTIQYNAAINEAVVRGLVSGRTYYVGVRAVHEGTIDDPNNPGMRLELNNKYFEIKTLTADESSIKYTASKYQLKPAAGAASRNSLSMNWGSVRGVFDHFRVYYAISGNGFSPDVTAPCEARSAAELLLGMMGCKKIAGNLLGTDLNDLATNSLYEAKLIVCISIDCDSRLELNTLESGTGTLMAGFGGLQTISVASSLELLGTMTLSYNPPNFEVGYFDGLAVEISKEKAKIEAWRADPVLNPKPTGAWPLGTCIITEEEPECPISVDPFDYTNPNTGSITVRGLDYSSSNDYCFAIYPFTYDANGAIQYKDGGAAWQCERTKIIVPDRMDYSGLNSAEVSASSIFLSWSKPDTGVYTHYEIFYRKATSAGDRNFSFATAILDTAVNFDSSSSYKRRLVPKDAGYDSDGEAIEATNTELLALENGYYNIGVLTYANLGNYVERSEVNSALYRCHVTGVTADDCEKL